MRNTSKYHVGIVLILIAKQTESESKMFFFYKIFQEYGCIPDARDKFITK